MRRRDEGELCVVGKALDVHTPRIDAYRRNPQAICFEGGARQRVAWVLDGDAISRLGQHERR